MEACPVKRMYNKNSLFRECFPLNKVNLLLLNVLHSATVEECFEKIIIVRYVLINMRTSSRSVLFLRLLKKVRQGGEEKNSRTVYRSSYCVLSGNWLELTVIHLH